MPLSDEQLRSLYGDPTEEFSYLQRDNYNWRDLNYDATLSREHLAQIFSSMSSDDYNSMIGRSTIQSGSIVSLSAAQLASGVFTGKMDLGNGIDNSFVRMSGLDNHFLVHDGENPRGLFGRKP